MLKHLQILALFLTLSISAFGQQGATQLAYIETFKDIAIREMDRAGVPASIKLAQGILESNAGQSTLARRARNHFGIKCGGNWKGDSFDKEDDDYDANGKLIKSCFRSYKNAQASYVAHSEFLRDPRKAFRYGFLFRLNPRDYKRWAHGLKQAGYATSATYPEKLITLIERYKLYEYDNVPVFDTERPSDIVSFGILKNNDVRYVVVNQGETLEDIARKADASIRNLILYNENIDNRQSPVIEGDRVYIQSKRNSYRGRDKYHTVKEGETMFAISQLYALKLSKLYKRNRMIAGVRPATNERVKLRGCKIKQAPKLYIDAVNEPTPFPNVPEGEIEFEDEEIEVMDDEFESPPSTVPPVAPTTPTTPVNPEQTGNSSGQNEGGGIIISSGNQPIPNDEPVLEEQDDEIEEIIEIEIPTATPVFHTVQSGDTLYSISRKYDTTVDIIKVLNGLNSNNIQLGLKLRVK